jgi:hypothetical protein
MKQLNKKSLLFVLALLVLAFAANSLVFAQGRAPFVVGDGTPASCTEAAFNTALTNAAANAEADTITFNCGGAVTIPFTTTKTVDDDLTINGGELITFDGGFTGLVSTGRRLFHVLDGSNVNFIGLTFANGNGTNGLNGNGGAILAYGNVNVTRSNFTGNYSGRGSGIASYKDVNNGQTNTPVVNVFQSAFINNVNTDRGVLLADGGVINVANSTFSGNIITNTGASNEGTIIRVTGGLTSVGNLTNVTIVDQTDDNSIFSSGKPLTVRNSIIVSGDPLCAATTVNPTDGSGNVIFGGGTCTGLTPVSTDDPVLQPLSTTFVPYYDLGDGSSALNKVTNDTYVSDNSLFSGVVTVDQNGTARPQGEGKDAGAIESDASVTTPTPETPTPETPTPETPTPETPTPETPTPETPVPGPGAFNLLSPDNGVVIRDTADVTAITWELSNGAESYEFILLKTSDTVRLGEVLRVDVLAENCGATPGVCTLAVGADVQSLLTDGQYSWTVEAENTEGVTEATNAPYTFTVSTSGVELVINGGFESLGADTKPVIDPWVLKNGSGDKVKCNKPEKPKFFAYTGECAWRFKGTPGDKAKLTQNIDPSLVVAGDVLTLSAAITTNVDPGKVAFLKIDYVDPTAGLNNDGRDKAVIELTGPTLNQDYEVFSVDLAVLDTPTKVKVMLKGKTESGKIYVDDVSVLAQPTTGGGAVLPLPLPLP